MDTYKDTNPIIRYHPDHVSAYTPTTAEVAELADARDSKSILG